MEMTFVYFAMVIIGIIIAYAACEWIHEFFEKRKEIRVVSYIEYETPRMYNQVTEMSIDVIKRINDNIYNQFCKEEES